MEEQTELTVVEHPQAPQQLITIEPAKYVELVFEPFAKRLADAKTLADAATFDAATTAGMAVAVKHRATFREIRVESEKARKVRKAPILEIGKLLDSRQKEIESEIEPYESRFDSAIKAEEQRKEAEKAAKAAAEKTRVDAIRAKIDAIRSTPAKWLNKPSSEIGVAADHLSETVIALEEWAEFTGEAVVERDHAVKQMREMQVAMQAHEAEQARLAEERAALERERGEAAERERVAAAEREAQAKRDREALAAREAELAHQERMAAAARQEREAKDRAERERVEREQQEAQERAAAAMRRQQEEHEARMRAQQEELDRQQAAIDAQRAEQERVAREAREAAEAAQKREADHAEALIENARIDADRLAAFEAQQQELQRRADEAERIRREEVAFILNGPGDVEMVKVIAAHYDVELGDAMQWFKKFDYDAADEFLAAENVGANRLEQAA